MSTVLHPGRCDALSILWTGCTSATMVLQGIVNSQQAAGQLAVARAHGLRQQKRGDP